VILAYILAHQNYFGIDDTLGPVAVSIIRDKVEAQESSKKNSLAISLSPYMYRIIIRLSDVRKCYFSRQDSKALK